MTRGPKRNVPSEIRDNNKRECRRSVNASSTVTLFHYFSKAQASATANADVTARGSISTLTAEAALQRDIDLAITLSLEQESPMASSAIRDHNTHGTNEVSALGSAGTHTTTIADGLSNGCDNAAIIFKEEQDDAVRGGYEKQRSFASQFNDVCSETNERVMTCATGPKLCPICETVIETKDMEKMNLHINRCLDATARCDQQQQSVTADRNSSLMAGLRQVFAPKDSNIMTAPLSTKGSIEKNPAVEQSCQVKKVTNPGRLCPYYKWMEDTKFTVDAFSYGKIPGCEGYFLSHYHSDHYHGLSKSWSNGPIYCSKVTANLVKQELGVGPHYVMPLALDEKHQLTETVSVTLIDANHCPGSVLFLFEVVPRKGGPPLRHLHTGDFRASPRMCLHPALRQAPINNLYLDTTYLDGHYSFPGQEEVVNAACDVAEFICRTEGKKRNESGGLFQWLKPSVSAASATKTVDELEGTLAFFRQGRKHLPQEQPRVLIVVGTYTIGKEKVFLHLARRLKSKVFVKEKKRRILKCQENEELSSLLTDDPYEAQIHVVGMWDLKVVALESYRQTFGSHFSSVLAFRPTGWTFGGGGRGYRATPTSSTPGLSTIIEPPADRSVRLRPDKSSTDNVKVYGIPYSEHSSFRELAAFICSLDIAKIIPTVNMSKPESQHRQYAVLNRWQYEKKVIGIKSVPYPSEDYW